MTHDARASKASSAALVALLALGALMAVPEAGAALPTVQGGTQTYNVAVFSAAADNPAAGGLFSHSINTNPIHGFATSTSFATLTFTYTAFTSATSAGNWRYQASWDGSNLASCSWDIETSSTLRGDMVYPFHGIFCRVEAAGLGAGSHTLAVTRTSQSGSPAAISRETISYRLDRTDVLSVDSTDYFAATNALITAHDDASATAHAAGASAHTAAAAAHVVLADDHSHQDAHHHVAEAALAAGFGNVTDYLDHVNAHLHAIDANIDATRGEILDAIASLNLTVIGNVTGNFTLDDATLSSIYSEILQHRENSLEVYSMGFDGLEFDGTVLLLLWLVALIWCMRNAKLFAALAATVGIFCVLIPGTEWIGWVGVLFFVLALWLEAVARDKLPYHWFKGNHSVERSV